MRSIKIFDITPFTQLDYPNTLAAILWMAGCNMRCSYCHNPHIVFGQNSYLFEDALSFLKKRANLLEGVVLSGGEPTLHPNLKAICSSIKELGYKIKLDTNGSRPDIVQSLLQRELLDFIAIDLKAPPDKYDFVTKLDIYFEVMKTIKVALSFGIDMEVRTTVHTDLLDEKDIEFLAKSLRNIGYKGPYYIQNFRFAQTLGDMKEQKRVLRLSIDDIEYRNF